MMIFDTKIWISYIHCDHSTSLTALCSNITLPSFSTPSKLQVVEPKNDQTPTAAHNAQH